MQKKYKVYWIFLEDKGKYIKISWLILAKSEIYNVLIYFLQEQQVNWISVLDY